jgi:hypothetical protein
MYFDIDKGESFETWFLREKPRLSRLAAIVGKPSRTDEQKAKSEDLTAHIDDLLEELINIKLEVPEYKQRAAEFYQDKLSKMTEAELELGWTKAKKTALDFCKQHDCNELRVLSRLEAMVETIDFRASVSQSMLRSLKP